MAPLSDTVTIRSGNAGCTRTIWFVAVGFFEGHDKLLNLFSVGEHIGLPRYRVQVTRFFAPLSRNFPNPGLLRAVTLLDTNDGLIESVSRLAYGRSASSQSTSCPRRVAFARFASPIPQEKT
jgi:hypothetical protein